MIRDMLRSWNLFWFAPRPEACMNLPRIAVCLVSAVWFASFWNTAPAWFSAEGLLSPSLSARILAVDQTPAWQVWSPLWMLQSSAGLRAWLVVGVGLSVLAASGLGGRLTQAALFLWAVAWANRLVALSSLVEPTLIACLAYLIVDPGLPVTSDWRVTQGKWSAGMALRLLQAHWWLLVAAGLLSQLGGLVWWRGEAVWWLAAAGRSNWLSVELLRGQASWINALTHAAIVVQLLALWLLCVPAARPVGIACGVLVACVYGGLADYGLFAAVLLAQLTSFIRRPWLSGKSTVVASASRRDAVYAPAPKIAEPAR